MEQFVAATRKVTSVAATSAGLLLLSSAGMTAAAAEDLRVVASIKPVHSLVASVMKGAGEPDVIVKGAASPHGYALRPSDAKALSQADLVFWIGPELEAFLSNSVENLAADAKVVTLQQTEGLILHPYREGGDFAGHDHGDHGGHGEHEGKGEAHHDEDEHHDEEKHDEAHHDDKHHEEEHHEEAHHGEEEHHDEKHHEEAHAHGDEKHHEEEHADHDDKHHDDEKHEEAHHDDHEGHEHEDGEMDAHLWLDPHNAEVMVMAIAAELSAKDPAHADLYKANARQTVQRIDELTAEVRQQLAPVQDKPFIVFHDAYQYFERRFGLQPIGSVTGNPDVQPGAKRVRELQEKMRDQGVVCIFSEPQFDDRRVSIVSQGTGAKIGQLDPLGASFTPGPELYEQVIRQIAAEAADCLG
ncbi:zinc ABC transporter substrate-binding protein [Rhodovibrionaceae bacterium A322]